VSAEDIVGKINAVEAHYVKNKNDVITVLRDRVNSGDAVIFMGAGDICEVAKDFVGGIV